MRDSKVSVVGAFLLGAFLFIGGAFYGSKADESLLTTAMIEQTESLFGLTFENTERDSMLENLTNNLANYQKIREVTIDNGVPPAINFNPIPVGATFDATQEPVRFSVPGKVKRPGKLEDAAFYSIAELAELIRSRQVTSEELTRMYLARLKKYDQKLHCVISLTEELAIEQAQRADREIAAGNYRGPLHGIPYGAKDLLATKNYRTTWGAEPFKEQVIDMDATVITKLEEAGAVLVAKLTLGALAWGDVWYGEQTRNPWNLEQGSSGSSAGSASATSAGLVGFAIGTETWGSIVSPSTRCGVSGLRPTYGRVSRHGAMALSWTMDKIGPICRTVEDCAIVFEAIYGPDGIDQTLHDIAFNYRPDIDVNKLRVGYLKADFDRDYPNKTNDMASLKVLKDMGVELIPITLPEVPVRNISFILSAEAGAAFDVLTRSNQDDLMVRQIRNAWPNVFRASRFIPAVEYINANRVRYMLIQEMAKTLEDIDIYIAPSFSTNLLLTNLTGHPCVVVPNGFSENGGPTSISFHANLFDEARLLAFSRAYQERTEFHKKHPKL